VIMLVNVGAEEQGREELFNKPRQVMASLIFCLLLVVGVLYAVNNGYRGMQRRDLESLGQAENVRLANETQLRRTATGVSRITKDTEGIGGVLYRYASLPFEIASVLLLVAIIGSVMLARTLKQEVSAEDVDPEVLQDEVAKDPELAELQPSPQE